MATAIKRWGNSLAVRLPSALTDLVKFVENQVVEIKVEGNRIVIEKSYDLEEMCRLITPQNMHAVTSWGVAVGNEFNAQGEDFSQL